MKFNYTVMGHTSRIDDAFKLLKQLTWQKAGGKFGISIDDGSIGVWENAKRAWKMGDNDADYTILLQDDVELTDDFCFKAERFIEQHKGHVISFYYGDNERAHLDVKPDYFDSMLNHAVCLAIPTYMIDDMIRDGDLRPQVEGDDMKMRRWLIANNRICRYSNPSLVQHRDIPSVVDPSKPVRQSKIYEA